MAHLFDEFQQEAQERIVARERPRYLLEFPEETVQRRSEVQQRTRLHRLRSSGGFGTTTVCVLKQSSERPLLLNFVMPVQLALLLQ